MPHVRRGGNFEPDLSFGRAEFYAKEFSRTEFRLSEQMAYSKGAFLKVSLIHLSNTLKPKICRGWGGGGSHIKVMGWPSKALLTTTRPHLHIERTKTE